MKIKNQEGVFDVEVKARKLRNGNRMQIILEKPYDAEEFAAMSAYQFERAKVTFEYHPDQTELEGVEE